MKLHSYLQEKIAYLVADGLMLILLVLFFFFFFPGTEIMLLFLGIIYLFLSLLPLFLEFKRKSAYYREYLACLEQLEDKLLLAEVLPQPEDQEEELLLHGIQTLSHDGFERLQQSNQAVKEYQEYLELWIHEIKTPIASATLAIENYGGEERQALAKDLETIENYVTQVLFYARSQSVEKDFIITRLQVQTLVYQVLRQRSQSFIDFGIKVNLESLDYWISSDSKWLVYILEQLLDNSIKYRAGENPYISFRAWQEAQSVYLELRDNGIGIVTEDISRVFEKGFTGHIGRNYRRSTGMGLYLCQKLAGKLGIQLMLSSEGEHKGTVVTLCFPEDQRIDHLRK